MPGHDYLSTACWHEHQDHQPGLHGSCRQACKFCDTSCTCEHHGFTGPDPVSWVDQAREIARQLLIHAGPLPLELTLALHNDPRLFWIRGDNEPSG